MCWCSGSCGTVCPTDPSAITICSQGTCIFQCTGGTTKCGTIFNPICVNTLSDNNNCGERPVTALGASLAATCCALSRGALMLCLRPEKHAIWHGAGMSVREFNRRIFKLHFFRAPQQEQTQRAWGATLVRLAGSCGFVCQSSYSCVTGVCTNTNFGKKLLDFPAEAATDRAAEDEESAVAEE